MDMSCVPCCSVPGFPSPGCHRDVTDDGSGSRSQEVQKFVVLIAEKATLGAISASVGD
jgi:hypothetical protein